MDGRGHARRLSLVAALALLVVGLSGCEGTAPAAHPPSSSGPSPGEASESADAAPRIEDPDIAVALIAPRVRRSMEPFVVSYDASTCLAEHLVEELGTRRALDLSTRDDLDDLDDLADPVGRAFVAGLNRCIPGDVVAPLVAGELWNGLGNRGRPAAAIVDCLAGQLDGNTGTLVMAGSRFEESGKPPTVVIDAMGRCLPREAVVDVLVREFRRAGLGTALSRCTAQIVADGVDLGEMARIGLAEKVVLPPEIQQLVEDAVGECSVDTV